MQLHRLDILSKIKSPLNISQYGTTLYRDYEALGFPDSNLSPKTQLKFYFLTVCQYWLDKADPKMSSDQS